MSMRALIVEDEPLARERLAALVADDPDVELAGECGDGPAAVDAIRELAPDVVFLDVEMPGFDGFRVVEEVGPADMPVTVFVTAYDQYAVKAFEVSATDYLLKPYDADRFAAALGRAKKQVLARRKGGPPARLSELLATPKPAGGPLERIAVKSQGSVVFVRCADLDWVEAAGNYTRLHAGSATHLLRETMTNLESKLDPKTFVRIHRSTIVNLERVRELQPFFHGDYLVFLKDGTRLTMSRNYRPKLQHLLANQV